MLKKRLGRKVSNRKLLCLLLTSNITNAFSRTIPQLEDAVDLAFKEYKKARTNAVSWRDEFLETLATAKAQANGTDQGSVLKQLRLLKQQRTTAHNVKRMQGKLERTATIQIYVNTDEGRQVVTDQRGIEAACIMENESRFSQSEDTPPMAYPLVKDLGYLADTPEADMILAGTYQPPDGTDRFTCLLLKELYMPDNIKRFPMERSTVTPSINQQAWKKQKETISSEPNGLSFSHYKAAVMHPDNNDFDAKLRSLPFRFGFSPTHWQHITDVEILKKAGVYDIDKMWTITLMDAAFNMNNKQLGRDLL